MQSYCGNICILALVFRENSMAIHCISVKTERIAPKIHVLPETHIIICSWLGATQKYESLNVSSIISRTFHQKCSSDGIFLELKHIDNHKWPLPFQETNVKLVKQLVCARQTLSKPFFPPCRWYVPLLTVTLYSWPPRWNIPFPILLATLPTMHPKYGLFDPSYPITK